MLRCIMHLDMDAFFAAVEQRDRPELRGKPVVVCSDPQGGEAPRGVIAAASYEAKRKGVNSGMPLYKARRIHSDLIAVSGNRKKYKQAHQTIFDILLRYSPEIEPASIDEFFADVSHLEKNDAAIQTTVSEIKRAIQKQLGEWVSASVGIGPNRLVAKLASNFNKPNGLTIVPSRQVSRFMNELNLEDLWGLGEKGVAKLRQMGIKSIRDLQNANEINLRRFFGINAYHIKRLARGQDSSALKPFYKEDPPKSMGHQVTLSQNTTDKEQLKALLAGLVGKVGLRLRAQGYQARTIKLILRYSDFKTVSWQTQLNYPTVLDKTIYTHAAGLLDKIFLKRPVRLVGVVVASLRPTGHPQQLSLWEEGEDSAASLQRTLDCINDCEAANVFPARLVNCKRLK